jgi:hypothetical protein
MFWWICGGASKVESFQEVQTIIDLLKERKSTESILKFLDAHLDCCDDCDENSKTALMYAAESDNIVIIERLLSMGADINAVDNLDQNVMFYSIGNNNRDLDTLLFVGGCNIHQINSKKEALIHLACKWGLIEAAMWLIENGINFNAKDIQGNLPINLLADREMEMELEECIFQKMVMCDFDEGSPVQSSYHPLSRGQSYVAISYSTTLQQCSPSPTAPQSVAITPVISRAHSLVWL